MAFIDGEDRYQTSLSIHCLDDSIDQNNSVRVIDAFVNILDMKGLGFFTYDEIKPGQNPYNRKDLLKLHIYGYMNGIRSSRKLEAETKRNLEVIWLIGKLTPDHGTISAFIKDNKKAFRQVLKEFSLILKGWGLVDGKLIAIDGTKLKADNSKKNYVTMEILNKKIQYIETQIDEYMTLLESNDQSHHNVTEKTEEIIAKIALYKSKKDHFKILQESMDSQGIKQLSFTDPDSRGMKNNGRGEVCYNVQTAVDSKNSLIVDCEVVNDINDLNQLSNMAITAKKVLKKRKLSVVADTGYYNAIEIKKCMDKKITLYIKRAKASHQTGDERYRKEQFKYNADSDIYICPEGKNLSFSEYSSKNGLRYKRYKGKECMLCPQKQQCTSAKQARNIQRWVHEEILEEVDNNTNQHPQIYKQRRCVVEHPFGVIKRNLHYTYFLRRGLESVNAEAASMFVAYNLKRIINIWSVPKVLERINLIHS